MWRLVGIDTFAREEYGLGSYPTRAEAMAAAHRRLAEIARQQPTETAGALQDGVAVIDPDGRSRPLDPPVGPLA